MAAHRKHYSYLEVGSLAAARGARAAWTATESEYPSVRLRTDGETGCKEGTYVFYRVRDYIYIYVCVREGCQSGFGGERWRREKGKNSRANLLQ